MAPGARVQVLAVSGDPPCWVLRAELDFHPHPFTFSGRTCASSIIHDFTQIRGSLPNVLGRGCFSEQSNGSIATNCSADQEIVRSAIHQLNAKQRALLDSVGKEPVKAR